LPINFQVTKQRILLINLYLNQIFNTFLLNNLLKQKHKASGLKTNFVPINITTFYKDSTRLHFYSLPVFPDINYKNDKQTISKVNLLLNKDKSISSEPCYVNENYQGGNIYRRRKQKTIKKKNRNIKNKNSLKNKIKIKMNKKIKKYVKQIIKKNNIKQQLGKKQQKQEKQQKQQQENKYRIKKFLNSKIYEKINKFKLNKTKNYSKNKSNHRKYTRKNY